MRFKNVLVLYKRSSYAIYSEKQKPVLRHRPNPVLARRLKKLKQTHDEHYDCLHAILKTLMTHGIRFTENFRGQRINYDKFDLVITVGGDGTFLEAARMLKNQLVFGVNSAPSSSVGFYCAANAQNFESILQKVMTNTFKARYFQRLRVKLNNVSKPVDALNDILVCHANPAMLNRYVLGINGRKEAQRGSGIWISTPAGSSGAIHSAGGKLINPESKALQYLPRELQLGKNRKYHLTGGVLYGHPKISVVSFMRRGVIYFDGAHHQLPFGYGIRADIHLSPHPLKTVKA